MLCGVACRGTHVLNALSQPLPSQIQCTTTGYTKQEMKKLHEAQGARAGGGGEGVWRWEGGRGGVGGGVHDR